MVLLAAAVPPRPSPEVSVSDVTVSPDDNGTVAVSASYQNPTNREVSASLRIFEDESYLTDQTVYLSPGMRTEETTRVYLDHDRIDDVHVKRNGIQGGELNVTVQRPRRTQTPTFLSLLQNYTRSVYTLLNPW